MNAAICYFAYKRADKVLITLSALLKCLDIENTPIVIFQDNAVGDEDRVQVERTKQVILNIIENNDHVEFKYVQWKKHVGPEISLIKGMEYVVNKYKCAIRIEEDIEVRSDFLTYMKASLEAYKNDKRVFAVCSFNPGFECNHDTFLAKPLRVWGYGIWADRFNKVVWDKKQMFDHLGKKNSEDLLELFPYSKSLCHENLMGLSWDQTVEDRMLMYHCFVNDLYNVYPNCSYVRNIGFDGSGVHSGYKTKKNMNFEKSINIVFDDYFLSKEENRELINSSIKSYHADFN